MAVISGRRTKIVCTIGPASGTPERIRHLIQAGMNVARLNFSHGTYEYHEEIFRLVRTASAELRQNVAILMDLQGPKIRTGRLRNAELVKLEDGQDIIVTTEEILGDNTIISTSYEHLPQDVKPGDRILMADGTLELQVRRVEPPRIHCKVVTGGYLGQHKGINLPGVDIAAEALTPKDEEDLQFAMKLGADYVALSFVRTPDDIRKIRGIIDEAGASTGVVAKIERPEALDHIDEILYLSDAVMIARGDLGVEVDFEEVPVIQKRLIHKCNEFGVPVITATQMLESMISHPRPTRAEVTDVANAIYDGTDAVMLSGETAAGEYPIEACAVMAKIAFRTDEEMAYSPPAERFVTLRTSDVMRHTTPVSGDKTFADAVGQAVCRMASALRIPRIVCFTSSGYTASAIARYRPRTRITAITPSEITQRRCALMWGVTALKTEDIEDVDEMVKRVEWLLVENRMSKKGDTIIIVAGTPLAAAGRTNLLKIHTIGEDAAFSNTPARPTWQTSSQPAR